MLRAIGAVLAGYAVMFVLVFVTFSGLYLAFGADGAFEPGTYDVSTLWLASSTVLNIVAALAGGLTCALIARGGRAPVALALFVLVLGLLMAIPVLQAPVASEPRSAEVPNMEAMMNARTPVWVALLTPVIGAVGVLAGAALRRNDA